MTVNVDDIFSLEHSLIVCVQGTRAIQIRHINSHDEIKRPPRVRIGDLVWVQLRKSGAGGDSQVKNLSLDVVIDFIDCAIGVGE